MSTAERPAHPTPKLTGRTRAARPTSKSKHRATKANNDEHATSAHNDAASCASGPSWCAAFGYGVGWQWFGDRQLGCCTRQPCRHHAYQVTWRASTGQTGAMTVGAGARRATVNGLTNGVSYVITVAARTA
ncbi:hypothetical protein [Kibdelosporangium philippinense]|uniref:hypothetical protein n=1 Tax=Kibdelosporangium philippinense TaxID=211113 RepID=UPI003616FD28